MGNPRRVALKETMKDVRNKHPMNKSKVCNFPCKTEKDLFQIDSLENGLFESCTTFASLSYKCSLIDPPLKIHKICCQKSNSFSKGPTLQDIPLLQKYRIAH